MKKLLVINAGSSSIKFRVYSHKNKAILADGLAERIFVDGRLSLAVNGEKFTKDVALNNHLEAIEMVMQMLKNHNIVNDPNEIIGIGHRIVQGGEYFRDSALIGQKELREIERVQNLAPLHNPAEIKVIKAFQKLAPNAKNVAVFDTAFHQTIPQEVFLYGVPYNWYQQYRVRKYGMHGTSHKYITREVEKILQKKSVNIISAHLGNGASITAIKNSKSVNTSMGLTPLAGIVMGTRCGDIDPAVIEYISKEQNKSVEEVTNDLNKKSGILGISGVSSDFRDVENAYNQGNKRAALAIEVYTKRVADVIAQYQNDLGNQVDAIVFTAGVGENAALIRAKIAQKLHTYDFTFDEEANKIRKDGVQELTTSSSKTKIFKIPTNEELMIVEDLVQKANL